MVAIVEERIEAGIIRKSSKEHGEKGAPLKIPKDKYLFCHIAFFFLGICHILPITFFSTANNYWMYTFRNISDSTMEAKNRTVLQKDFASIQMMVNTMPSLLVSFLNILYGHKFKIINKIIAILILDVLIFSILTAFIKINTDNYQTGFFIMVMVCLGALTGGGALNTASTVVLYPRFPHQYMETCLTGENISGLIGDMLNLISVFVIDDITNSTLMYFMCGSFIVTVTLILIVIMSRTEFYKYHLNTIPEDHKKDTPSRKEIFGALYKVRLSIFLFFICFVGLAATHPSITSLVVSEQNRDTSIWARKYFSPLVTFFLTDFSGLIGRFLASTPYLKDMPDKPLYIVSTVATVTFIPLIWLCNAQPRKHLPVVFNHDFEYAIILSSFMVLNSYFTNTACFTIPRKTTKHEAEIAFAVMVFVINTITSSSSFIGISIVNIL